MHISAFRLNLQLGQCLIEPFSINQLDAHGVLSHSVMTVSARVHPCAHHGLIICVSIVVAGRHQKLLATRWLRDGLCLNLSFKDRCNYLLNRDFDAIFGLLLILVLVLGHDPGQPIHDPH